MGAQPSCSDCGTRPCATTQGQEAMLLLSGISSIKIPWVCSPRVDAQVQSESGCLCGPGLPPVSSPLALISRASWVVLAGSARRVQLLIKADRNLRCYSPTVVWVYSGDSQRPEECVSIGGMRPEPESQRQTGFSQQLGSWQSLRGIPRKGRTG